MPTPPLPEQPGRTPVPAVEVARAAYCQHINADGIENVYIRVLIDAAFIAGWDAASTKPEPGEARHEFTISNDGACA